MMDDQQIDALLELGRTNPKQFELELGHAAEQNVEVGIEFSPLIELPDDSIVLYWTYVNNLSKERRCRIKEGTLHEMSIEKDVPDFKRACFLLKHLKIGEVLMQSLPCHRRVDVFWINVMCKALKYFTFEELTKFIDLKGSLMNEVPIGGVLNSAVKNSDPRAFDFFYERFVRLDRKDQLNRLHIGWKKKWIHSRSAFKLAKLKLSLGDWIGLWNVEVFKDWSLLGYFATPKLIDRLSLSMASRDELTKIAIDGERVRTCLHSRLPRVLVEMVLQYLI